MLSLNLISFLFYCYLVFMLVLATVLFRAKKNAAFALGVFNKLSFFTHLIVWRFDYVLIVSIFFISCWYCRDYSKLGEALMEGEGLTAFLHITQYWSVPLIFLWVFCVILLDIILVCMVIVWWYKNYLLEHLGENSLKALGYNSTQATATKLGKILTSAGVASIATFTAGKWINEHFYSDNYRKYLESITKLPTERVPMVSPPKKSSW